MLWQWLPAVRAGSLQRGTGCLPAASGAVAATPSRAGVNNPDLRRVRGLAWAGVLGCVFFLVAAGLLQLTRSDLDPWQHTLSFYLHGPGSLWLCLAYLLLGVAMAAGGRLLCRLAPAPSPAGQAVMACLAVAGV